MSMKIDFIQLIISCIGIVSAFVGLFFAPNGLIPCKTWVLPMVCLGILLLSGCVLMFRAFV